MSKRLDIKPGDKFSRLTIIKEVEGIYRGGMRFRNFLCRCDCGNLCEVTLNDMRTKNTRSCGCIKKETSAVNAKSAAKHGMTNSLLYGKWLSMRKRCYSEYNNSYVDYGGRGIKVCDEWLNEFKAFYSWAMANGYRDGLSIERKDVNGNYCPENCEWITVSEQCKNKRTTKLIEFDGESMILRDWAQKLNLSYGALKRRLQVGWSIEKTLTTPLAKWSKYYEA